MKKLKFLFLMMVVVSSAMFVSCGDDDKELSGDEVNNATNKCEIKVVESSIADGTLKVSFKIEKGKNVYVVLTDGITELGKLPTSYGQEQVETTGETQNVTFTLDNDKEFEADKKYSISITEAITENPEAFGSYEFTMPADK